MSEELLNLYERVQNTKALSIRLPEELGMGQITRLDTSVLSLSSWEMNYFRNVYVEGNVAGDMRLLFCMGDGAEWKTLKGMMHLDRGEACLCFSDPSCEAMDYLSGSRYLFHSVSVPRNHIDDLLEAYISQPSLLLSRLSGSHFPITQKMTECLRDLNRLGSIHDGLEMMRAEAHVREAVSLCLQSLLYDDTKTRKIHPEDLAIIRKIRERIDNDPGNMPEIAAVAKEYGMSISKLTRAFKQVTGTPMYSYVTEARLALSLRLLAEGGISIGEVSERAGYSKPGRFSAAFKNRFGVSPRDYQNGRHLKYDRISEKVAAI